MQITANEAIQKETDTSEKLIYRTARKQKLRLQRRLGLSLLELLACVTIMSILAIALIPNVRQGTSEAKRKSCSVNTSVIEVQTAMWHRAHGKYPETAMQDIGEDPDYFPDGLPICPVEGKPYEINQNTGAVVGHEH